MSERITDDPQFDGAQRHSHVYRYALAGKYLQNDWTVVDGPCGTGYAQKFLPGNYIGLDKNLDPKIDLNVYEPTFQYDAWLCFEGPEHFARPEHVIDLAHRSRHFCAFSVPIYPGAEDNPFHVRAWTTAQLWEATRHPDWKTCYSETQAERYFMLFQERR